VELTVYQENEKHVRSTAFRWRCDEVKMRGTCLEAETSMQANLVINSSKLYQDIADISQGIFSKDFPMFAGMSKFYISLIIAFIT